MLKLAKLRAVCALFIILTGCLESRMRVSVNTDGSGTIEQVLLLTESGMALAGDIIEEPGAAELLQIATRMGTGVEAVSSRRFVDDATGRTGLRTVFRFKGVNTVRVSQSPLEDPADAEDAPYVFTLSRQDASHPARLDIHSPLMNRDLEPSAPQGSQPEPETAQMEMFKELLADLRVTRLVEVNGQIVTTNASYQEGNVITLLDMPFSAILANEEAFLSLQGTDAPDPVAITEILGDELGILVETQNPVVVEFRGAGGSKPTKAD